MEQHGKILIVDDEYGPRESLKMILKPRYECFTADSGLTAIPLLKEHPDIDLVTLDLHMPGMGGIDTLVAIKEFNPEIEAIIITGVGTLETLSKALQLGAFDHIAKPFNLVEINVLVKRAITRRRLREKFKSLFPADADICETLTAFVNRRYRKEDISFLDFVRVFSLAMQDKDPQIFSHVNRVTFYSMLIAEKFGFPPEERENLQVGTLLHDIGRMGLGLPSDLQEDKLTEKQREILRKHPQRGIEILEPLDVAPTIRAIIRWHHERYDGKGYPDGLKGEEIPLSARIVALANAYDGMTQGRAYRNAYSDRSVQFELKRVAGTAFDPLLVKTFLRAVQTGGLVHLNRLFGTVIEQGKP